MAIVRNITNEGIQLEVINTVKNYASGKHDFDNNSMAVKHLYDGKYPYEFCNTSMTTLQWIDCGVEYMMQDEIYFITPIIGDDIQVRYIDNGEFADLTAQNLVYWILKDYKIDFGEARFLERYFKDDTPIYTRFHNGEDISFCYHKED